MPGDARDCARWDEFVMGCAAATFFHRAGWQRVLQKAFRHETHFLYVEAAGRIEGVLPLAHVRSLLFGQSLVSLPFAVYGGVAANSPHAAMALEREAEQLARRLGVSHLELRHVAGRHPDWPSQDLYVTFRKAILPDAEANLLAIPRKQRAMVRKGIKRGLRSEIDAGADRFFRLYADNMHRHGTPPFSRSYFERLLAVFRDSCEIMTVTDERGSPVSGVLSFYFRDEVLPYYAGDTVEARELAANDFKYWELLRRACERGVRTFDYGRSKRGTGSFDFK
jgi:FemAB-related protein (PEP-CTERM system-associated)